jgi:hypothetical protein
MRHMKIFWSWQSDSPKSVNQHFVKDALQTAIEHLSADLGLTEPERPELDHDTKGEPGLVEIVSTIFKKIDGAAVFVADVTPIAETVEKKLLPNPNVMIELGYALKSLGHERIVLVANRAFGGRPEDLPFDLRHRRGPITYELKPGAPAAERAKVKRALSEALVEALKANLGSVLAKRDSDVELVLHPAAEGDRSTWLQPGAVVEHQDFFNGAGQESWVLTQGTRAYMRVTPTGWAKPKPSRREVQEARDQNRLWAYGRWVNGDGGANALGVVAVGMHPLKAREVHAVTQWFDKTGEVWGFNSLVVDEGQDGKLYLSHYRVLKDWATFLDRALAFLMHFGATAPFRVEAGIGQLKNVHWAGGSASERSRALEPDVTLSRQSRDWGPGARLSFVTDVYNALCDAFNQPRLSQVQVQQILGSVPE